MRLELVTDGSTRATLSGEYVPSVVALPPMDWGQEVALVVDMGEQRTAGYGVTVTDVRQAPSGEVELLLEVRQPGRGQFVAQVLTHPYAVARVPRAWLQGGEVTVIGRDQHGREVARRAVRL